MPSEIPDARFAPGTIFAERYRIIGTLGKGGMGEVYRADDLKLGQPVALKFLPEELTDHPDRLRRFHNEVRIARQVSHPNVCRVYDIGEYDGLHYLSMEYIDGEDLGSLLRRIGRLSTDKALENARQICAGLGAAHERGILHRDLKPANIMIDGRGVARIADFGLAGLSAEFEGAEIRAGTPGYMSPEQLEGTAVTVQSDLYSLGVVLYEMFTGHRVFEGMTIDQIRDAQRDSRLTPLSDISPEVDPAVESAILRCLSSDPEERPMSAYQVAASFPGGDPLAAALAAGEVPSPELVAASGDEGTLRPAAAISLLVAFILGLGTLAYLNDQSSLVRASGLEKPPEVLIERSREILSGFGYADKPFDTAWGMHRHGDFLRWVAERDSSPDRWKDLAERRPGGIGFWYRESQQYLIPRNLVAQVGFADPAATVEGMSVLKLDPRGHLSYLLVIPPEVDSTRLQATAGTLPDSAAAETVANVNGTGNPSGPSDPSWSQLLESAGLDPALLEDATPIWTPRTFSDERRAWTGTYPEEPDMPIRVEAGAYAGKINYFDVLHPWSKATLTREREDRGVDAAQMAANLLVVAVLVGACYLARRNMALGRGDRRGATRLATVIVVFFTASLLLDAHHVPRFQPEWNLFTISTGIGLFLGGFLYVLYQALEPYVRRMWPRVLISWNRLLTGRWNSPRVGRDFLIGAAISAGAHLLAPVYRFVQVQRGNPPELPGVFAFDVFDGLRGTMVILLGQTTINAIWVPLALLAFVLLLRFLVRHDLGAVLAAYAVFGTIVIVAQSDWIMRIGSLVWLGAMWWTLIRFGVVASAGFFLVYFVNQNLPIGLDFSSWWGGSVGLVMALLIGLGILACRIAMGPNWLTRSDLIPDERPRTMTRASR